MYISKLDKVLYQTSTLEMHMSSSFTIKFHSMLFEDPLLLLHLHFTEVLLCES